MATTARKIKQLRYYAEPIYDDQGNITNALAKKNAGYFLKADYCNETTFSQFAPIEQLGIQTLPGTKFYINQSLDPIIIGGTGIYELDLRNTTAILTSLRFDQDSMTTIANLDNGFLIIDLVYTGGA